MVAKVGMRSRSEIADVIHLNSVIIPNLLHARLAAQSVLILCDIFSILFARSVVNFVWFGSFGGPFNFAMSAVIIPLYAMLAVNGQAYAVEALPSTKIGGGRAVKALVFATATLVLFAYALKVGGQISRISLIAGSVLGALLLLGARWTFAISVGRNGGGRFLTEVVILDGMAFDAPHDAIVIDAAAADLGSDLRDPFVLDRIGALLAPADRVVIACRPERRRDWAMLLKGANIRGEIISEELTDLGPLGTARFGEGATILVSTGSLALHQRAMKRALDVGLASLGILLLAPLLVAVGVAVRLESRGPALFIQPRVGRGNRLFNIYKFRSMRMDGLDRDGRRSAARGDDRVTRMGRILRATSADELPQLWNILKGDMSFVGPRPHALGSLADDQPFWEIDERYTHRHACKPGLTGLAQVRGFRGATHRRSDLVNRLQADLEYNAGWTIWRDVAILLATVRVIMHRNAY